MEEYIIKDGKRLRLGYTTGSCAAAAAKAACFMLLTGRRKETVELLTPKGILLTLSVLEITQGPDFVSCAIRKDSGDDPDATRDTLIFASVRKTDAPGRFSSTAAPVSAESQSAAGPARGRCCHQLGAPAHDRRKRLRGLQALRLPRRHFCDHLCSGRAAPRPKDVQSPPRHYRRHFHSWDKRHRRAHERAGAGRYHPRRAAPAARNPVQTTCCSRPETTAQTIFAPASGLDPRTAVLTSNFIGDALEICRELGFSGALLVGHIGKLVKLSGGMWNTHSKYGDCRMELLAAHAAALGRARKRCKSFSPASCATTAFAF